MSMSLKSAFQYSYDYFIGVPKDKNGERKYEMLTFGDGVKGLITGPMGAIKDWLNESPKRLAAWTSSFGVNIDDRVDIPTYTKTLTGEDFATLYSSPEIVTRKLSDGTSVSIYDNSKSSYNTEMMFNFGDSMTGKHVSYESLSANQKVTYETTMLFKKYTDALTSNPDDSKLKDEFGTKLHEYESYCKNNGIDWDMTLHSVSTELQLEIYNHNKNFETLAMDHKWSESSRDVAVGAHEMLLQYAGKDFDDKIPTGLSMISREQLHIDENGHYSFEGVEAGGARATIGNKFCSTVDSIRSIFHEASDRVRDGVAGGMSRFDNLVPGSVDSYDTAANKAEFKGSKEILTQDLPNAFKGLLFDKVLDVDNIPADLSAACNGIEIASDKVKDTSSKMISKIDNMFTHDDQSSSDGHENTDAGIDY